MLCLIIPSAARADTAAAVNALRAQAGLPALAADADPELASLAADAAANPGNRRDANAAGWESQPLDCRCMLTDALSRPGDSTSDEDWAPEGSGQGAQTAQQSWRISHGLKSFDEEQVSTVGFAGVRASDFAALARSAPGVDALILDPRARSLTVEEAGDFAVIAVRIDPAAGWAAPVLAGARVVDPRHTSRVIVPADNDAPAIDLWSAGRWRAAGSPGDDGSARTPTGARSLAVDAFSDGEDHDRLAFSARYRVRLATGGTVEFHTTAMPAPLRRAGVAFERSIGTGGRRAFRDGVAHANRSARRLIDLIDGLASVGAHSGGEGTSVAYPATMQISYHRGHLTAPARERRMIVLHELGHLVDGALLDPWTRQRLDELIPRGGKCRSNPRHPQLIPTGACAQREERFADTFAKWALGSPLRGVRAGYSVRAPRNLRAWGRVLLSGIHLRPGGKRLGLDSGERGSRFVSVEPGSRRSRPGSSTAQRAAGDARARASTASSPHAHPA